jgi:hypothetical protein
MRRSSTREITEEIPNRATRIGVSMVNPVPMMGMCR